MPVWRLGRVDLYGEWGWLKIKDAKVLLHIIGRLRGFESTTWGEIEKKKNSGGGKQNHPIPIDRICRDALKRLEEINLDDIDELYQLRIGSKQRLWGIRDNEALKILWWDPKHTVYPVQKRLQFRSRLILLATLDHI